MTGKTELEKKLLGSKLWSIWLWICIVLSALADVNVIVSLGIQNISFNYIIFPLILLILDLALAACAAVSNFRFRHSLIAPILYGVFTVLVTLAFWIWFALTVNYVIFTNSAFVMWIVMQLLTVAVTILSAIRASGSGFIMRLIVCIFAVIYAAYGIAYIIMVGYGGFFGQAGDGYSGYSYSLRTIGYTYNENTDTYTASTVLSGDGNTVVVPEEFNGRKVTAVSSGLLTARGVSTLILESEDPVDIMDANIDYNAKKVSSGFRIYAPVSAANYYRNEFYSRAETSDESDSECPLTDLGNCVKPITAEGESYISFTYTYENLKTANFEALSDIVVENGTTFQSTLITDSYDYMVHCDESSEADRCISYTSTNGKILSTLMRTDGNELINSTISSDQDVSIAFADVYQISVLDGNDTKYSLPDEFKHYSNTDYRYVTANYCTYLLSGIESREGFSYTWEYYGAGSSASYAMPISDFASVLSDGMSIFPAWELNAPAAPSITGSTSITYGDTLSLTASFTAAYSWLTVSYSWTSATGESLGTAKTCTSTDRKPSDSGTYHLYVTISAPSRTSLTASSSTSAYVSVSKKTLSFTWTPEEEMTYSSSLKTIGCSYNENDVVNGDTISYTLAGNTATNAGTYTARATLASSTAALYTPSGNSYTYTISPYELAVTWGETSFTYDGQSHVPEYSYSPLGNDDVPGTVTGAITNAGSGTAVLTITDGNYTLSGDSTEFTIEKAEVSLVWGDADLTYNGTAQTPSVTGAEGLVNGESFSSVLSFTYSGAEQNAGEGYTATAVLSADNYCLASDGGNSTCDFTISAYELTVNWGSLSLTYSGYAQTPSHTYSISKLGGDTITDSLLNASVAGDETATGTGYTVTLTIDNSNYTLADGTETASFEIVKKALTLIWDTTSFTYNSEAQYPTAVSVTGLVADDTFGDLSFTYDSQTSVNAGTYTQTASMTAANYCIADGGESTSYTIAKKTVSLTWGDTSFTYNGYAQYPEVTAAEGYEGTDSFSALSFTYGRTSSRNAGTYTQTAILSAANYCIEDGGETTEYTIAKTSVSLNWDTASFTYNGSAQYPTVTSVTGLKGTDSFSVLSFAYGSTDSVDAGNYTQTAVLTAANYYIADGEDSTPYTIGRKTVTLNWGDTSFTYNGYAQYPTVSSVDGLEGTDTMSVLTFTYSNTESKDAGDYTQTATLTADNYVIADDGNTTSYTISKKDVTLIWNGTSFIYSGSAQYPAVSSVTGLQGSDTMSALSFAYSNTTSKDAGDYTQTATLTAANYSIASGSETTSYSIARKTVNVTWTGATEFTYDGSSHAPGVTTSDIVDSVTLSVSGAQTNAGTYTAAAVLSDYTNYTLSNDSCTFTISPKTITIEWDMSGTTPVATPSDSGARVLYVYYAEDGTMLGEAPSDPGNYSAEAVVTDKNYTLAGDNLVQSFTITEA
ncbi:MAG: hypothetical protein LUD51_03875 [Clostridia bacterium]|nr:hypothetical protein [Clostridia bacterium]